MMHIQSLFLVSLVPLIQAAETVLGAYIFHRHGDRTTKSYPPTKLTPLGYQQVYQSGEFYRSRYITNGSTQLYGVSTDVVKNSQLSVQTAVDTVLQNSATGFLQGLYPPVGVTLGSQTLANGTSIEEPLGGYQLIPVSVLASESSVANSGDSTWLEGNSGCENAIISSNDYFTSADYLSLLSSTGPFYQTILPVINNTFTTSTDTYKNAYAIWDLIQVSMIHNSTIQSESLLTPDVVTQVSTLANHHEFALGYNASEPIRAIAGSTLAAQIIQQLNATLTSGAPLLSVQFGEYASFLSFFGLASLPSVSVNFTGITAFASSMTFELVTNSTPTAAGYPPMSEISVRFLFSNGSAAENPLTPYPLFGQSSLELPWATFLSEMESFAIGNQTAWCAVCGSSSTACSSTVTSAAPTATVTSAPGSRGGLSVAVGGVIGAMVTLAVILGLEAALLLLAGLRVVKKTGGGESIALGGVSSGKV